MWWTLFTIILVAALTALVFYVFNKKITVKWWEWVLFALGILLFVFGLQNLFGGLAEGEAKAAWLLFATFGILGLILITVPAVLAFNRNKAEA